MANATMNPWRRGSRAYIAIMNESETTPYAVSTVLGSHRTPFDSCNIDGLQVVEAGGVAAEQLGGDIVTEARGLTLHLVDGAGEVGGPGRIVRRVHEPAVAQLLDARPEQ